MNDSSDALRLIIVGVVTGLCGLALWHALMVWDGRPGIEQLWGGF